MATKNFSRSCVALSALILTLASCRARPPRGDVARPPESAPTPNVETAPAPPPVAPAPPPLKTTHRVALILGPGGAKAFAHVGVLKALQRQRIPIDRIVGLEWGSLVAGLFAHHAQIHDVEWKLYKLEQQNLPRPKGFFARAGTTTGVKVMDPFLADAFGRDGLGGAKVKFSCPTRTLWSGVVGWQDRGEFKDVVKKCLAFPPVFNIEGSFLAGASQLGESVDALKREGFDVIVFVNVLGSGIPSKQDGLPENATHVILWQEVRRALAAAARRDDVETLDVNTNAFPILQFESGRELTQLGETAGAQFAPRLVQKFGF